MQAYSGYVEGYYGQLLDWPSRHRLLDRLNTGQMNTYFYAPKEDPCHRRYWRRPYGGAWRSAFQEFATHARQRDIHLIAGIAPGLDFDFSCLDTPSHDGNPDDFTILLEKARGFLADGAAVIGLLMDDIAADFALRCGSFDKEGVAHAQLCNRLGTALGAPIILVPRIYADSLISTEDTQSQTYLDDLVSGLADEHLVVYCGDDIVAWRFGGDVGGRLNPEKLIIWDNFYANDYCPRRLFLGPWRHRGAARNVLLNPTGMIETDLFLLDLMAASQHTSPTITASSAIWHDCITDAGIPAALFDVAAYFDAPYGFEPCFERPPSATALAALEELLWGWKSPLQREWYPALMGLKQDLTLASGAMPLLRIQKTQLGPLADSVAPLAAKP